MARDPMEDIDPELMAAMIRGLSSGGGQQMPSQAPQPEDPALAYLRKQAEAEQQRGPVANFMARFAAGYQGRPMPTGREATESYLQEKARAQTRGDARTRMQGEYVKILGDALKDISGMDPDTKTRMAPVLAPFVERLNKLAEVDVDRGTLMAAISSPESADSFRGLYSEEDFTPEERNVHHKALKGMKSADQIKYLGEVEKRKQDELTGELGPQVAPLVKRVREKLGRGDKDAVTVEEVKAALPKLSRLQRRAVEGYLGANAISLGLTDEGLARKAAEAEIQAEKQLKVAAEKDKPPIFDRTLTPYIAMAPSWPKNMQVADFAQLPAETQNKVLGEARKLYDAELRVRPVDVGRGVEDAKRSFPITPKERSEHFDVDALIRTGQFVQPPAGTTREQLATGGAYAYADDKQRERFSNLAPARQMLDTFEVLSKRLITAEPGVDTLRQGIDLYAGALTGSNPIAKGYRDASEGFLSHLARTFGEKGVLTNEDISRVRSAVVATFFDSAKSRDIKHAITRDIYNASHKALVNEMSGRPFSEQRAQIQELLQRLDDETGKSLAKATRPGKVIIRNRTNGELRSGPKGAKVPEGWEVLN